MIWLDDGKEVHRGGHCRGFIYSASSCSRLLYATICSSSVHLAALRQKRGFRRELDAPHMDQTARIACSERGRSTDVPVRSPARPLPCAARCLSDQSCKSRSLPRLPRIGCRRAGRKEAYVRTEVISYVCFRLAADTGGFVDGRYADPAPLSRWVYRFYS